VEPAAQVALAWLLERPAVTSLVIGARTGEQLADNLVAADLSLSAEERDRLEEVSRRPLLYPYWHQAKTASDRLGPADLLLLSPPGRLTDRDGAVAMTPWQHARTPWAGRAATA
jgi:hypothetical protein